MSPDFDSVGESAVGSVQSPEYDLLLRMLREVRIESGLSQRELSHRLGQAASYVYKIEAGSRRLDLVELARLLRALDRNLTDFIGEYAKHLSAS